MKNNNFKIFIILAFVISVLLNSGCLDERIISSNTVKPDTPVNPTAPEDLDARDGYLVAVDLIVSSEDGIIVDTTLETVARAYNIFADRKYTPLSFIIGSGGVIDGLDSAVLGMREGDNKFIFLEAEDAYGRIKKNLFEIVPRIQPSPRIQDTTVERFKANTGVDPEEGLVVKPESLDWPVTVIRVSNDIVTMRYDPPANSRVETLFGDAMVSTSDTQVLINLPEPAIGYPINNEKGAGRVYMVNDTAIGIDYNHEYAGKNLGFNITMLSVKRIR